MNSVRCNVGNFKGLEIAVGMEIISGNGVLTTVQRIETIVRAGNEVVAISPNGYGMFYEMEEFSNKFSPILRL